MFRLGDGLGVGRIHKDKFTQRLSKQWCHDAVRFGKGSGHNGFDGAEGPQHIDVLRALAGVEERDLGRGTMTAGNALRAQGFPYRRLIGRQAFERLSRFVREVGGISIVDHQTLRGAQVRFGRRGRRRCLPCLGSLLY